MKLNIPFTCIFLLYGLMSFAQDDKKEWAKKLKEMDPLALKALYQERDQLKTDLESKSQEITSLTEKVAEKKRKLKI